VEPRRATFEELLAELGGDLDADGADVRRVLDAGEAIGEPGRELGARELGEALDLARVGHRHDAREDGHVGREAVTDRPLPEREVVLGLEEELRDDELGAGADLLDEVTRVVLEARRLRMPLGMHGHAHREIAGPPRVDELHEIDRVLEARVVDHRALGHAGRGIPAEGEDVLHAARRERVDDAAELLLVGEDRREVRDGRERGLLRDARHDAERAIARGAAGAVGHGDEGRLERRELVHDDVEERVLRLRGLRREELEAEGPPLLIDEIAHAHESERR